MAPEDVEEAVTPQDVVLEDVEEVTQQVVAREAAVIVEGITQVIHIFNSFNS